MQDNTNAAQRPYALLITNVFTLLALGHLTRLLDPAPCRIPGVTGAARVNATCSL
ncbi:hypothetical protein SAMN06272771_7681 [Streptomyces sp. Ag82_O1-12]|uniref:hypothetical protein n=1 Tax=unclassified Streptomyces TaxID=2593676 RepID=UPI000BC515B5|nr:MULTISPECIES: hypothetical protein [unclassified Streptomyces]SMQ21753.1 hypothetical protein SAMN06272771_7681 [Streptomyces sp. Ag82_O1-12]SOD50165.1 hypothetical protein SAMN06272727_7691 [Streptomyces sp. Ag82_G6-1]